MPDGSQTNDDKKILISDSAAKRINELVAAEDKESFMMRVSVNGGGCSGFTYSFDLDDNSGDEDLIFEHAGAKVVIDDMSLEYLKDAQLDYVEDLMGSYFAFKNPNAASTCGCGSSFSI